MTSPEITSEAARLRALADAMEGGDPAAVALVPIVPLVCPIDASSLHQARVIGSTGHDEILAKLIDAVAELQARA